MIPMNRLFRRFALALLALLLAGLPGAARTAVWLAPGEPLGQLHLEALVEPALPPGEAFALSFTQPSLPLHNPASDDAFVQLLELRLDPRTERFSGAFLVRLESGEERVLGLAGQAQALVEVLVPVRSIGAGELLTADLLEPLVVAERQLRADTITDPAALQDVEARRRLLPGRPVRQRDVQAPRLVRRNETVEIVYRAPGIELVTMGRALEDGSRGSVVGVSNLDSGQRLAGVVTGARRITVGGASGAAR
jgi:flagella basal body P-ring formation protein FlgA